MKDTPNLSQIAGLDIGKRDSEKDGTLDSLDIPMTPEQETAAKFFQQEARDRYERAQEGLCFAQTFRTKPEGYEMIERAKEKLAKAKKDLYNRSDMP